tara:strand:- start:34258 stop:34506 length:249 start_codon:yes stop_codon:yes gene_type:complete
MKRSDSRWSQVLIAIGFVTAGLAGALVSGYAMFVLGRSGAWWDVVFVSGVLLVVVVLVRGLACAAAGSFERGWKGHHENGRG